MELLLNLKIYRLCRSIEMVSIIQNPVNLIFSPLKNKLSGAEIFKKTLVTEGEGIDLSFKQLGKNNTDNNLTIFEVNQRA